MKDLKHTSARGAAWNLVQNLTSRVLALAVVAILSRILDQSAFGGVALAITITTFVELFVNQGYAEFITQTPKLEREHLDTAFWFNVAVGAMLSGVIAVCARPLAVQFDEPGVAPVIRWISLSLLVRSFSVVPAGILMRELKFRSLSMRTVVAAVIGGTSGIVAALSDLGVYALVIQFLVGDCVATLMLWRATEWRPGWRVSKAALVQLSSFGTPIIAATLLAFVSRRFDTLIVGHALGLAVLGVYSMAQRVFQIAIQVINKSTTDVAFSALSRLADSEERRARAFCKVIELTAVVCFPIYVGLAVIADPLTVTLFGAQWVDSASVLVPFALSGVPFSLSLVHLAAIKSAAKTRGLFLINLTLLVVYLPVMFAIVDRGPTYAAIASLVSCVAILPLEIGMLRAALSFRIANYLQALTGAATATVVMTAATLGTMHLAATCIPLVQLITTVSAGAAVYVVALRVLAPGSFARVRDLVISIVRKAPARPR